MHVTEILISFLHIYFCTECPENLLLFIPGNFTSKTKIRSVFDTLCSETGNWT